MSKVRRFRRDDLVIYRTTKRSSQPGRRAQSVFPSSKGEGYTYCVDKFWIVDDVLDDSEESRLLVRTRRGKERVVKLDDPLLRHPSWFEKLFFGHRFPLPRKTLETVTSNDQLNNEDTKPVETAGSHS